MAPSFNCGTIASCSIQGDRFHGDSIRTTGDGDLRRRCGRRSRCFSGRVLDVSLSGCLIECAHTLKVGDYVHLRVFLPDEAGPLNVPLAAVRWVDNAKVGVEFIRSSEEDQQRLGGFVHRHRPPSREKKWKEARDHPRQNK